MNGLVIAMTLAAGMFAGTDARGNPFGEAAWLRDPCFRGENVQDVFAAQETKAQATRLRNIHTYFREQINLPAAPAKAVLHVTGDDYYKFYINGRFVVQGPEPAYPFAHPYYTLEIARFLRKGENCLASHAYYHGLTARAFNSADNRSGFMLVLELTFPDGSHARYATDETWKCHPAATFPSSHTFGYATQFNENIDMRVEPVGWRKVGFEDSNWRTPLFGRQDHVLVKQLTPPLEHWRADPLVVKRVDKGCYFYDFGREIVGHTRIRLQGPAGHVITVRHGEELTGKDTVRYKMRCNCDYEDKITLSGRQDLIDFYDYRGFRYVEIRDAPSEPRVWVDVRHYPFDASASHFHSSDELLNRIWTLSKNGIQMGCQGIFVDCPQREKGQYVGDTYLTALSQLILTADPRLTRKAIKDFQLSQRFDAGILAVAPGGFRQGFAEWSLIWPMLLKYHYWMTGDKALLREMADAGALDKLLGYFAELEGRNGLLTGVNDKKPVLVDWPPNLRGGYDYERTKNGENAVVNAFYYASLRSAAALMRELGRDGSVYDARADRLEKAFVRCLLDSRTGLFLDGTGSHNSSLHASGYALDFGLVPKRNVPNVVDLIRRKRLDCGVYAAPYVIGGCFKAGQPDLAYDLITSTDKHSWHEMLKAGTTTPLEAWAPELKWNTSWCQPCGGTPIYLIVNCLMGLQPAEPGWKAVRLAPRIPPKLDHIEVRFPVPTGSITAKYDKQKCYWLTVPVGTRVDVDAPKNITVKIRHIGKKQ